MWRYLTLAFSLLSLSRTPVRSDPPLRLTPQWVCRTEAPPAYRNEYDEGPATLTSRYLIIDNLHSIIERSTGKIVWRQGGVAANAPASFAGAELRACSTDNIALVDAPGFTEGIDLVTGAILWTFPGGKEPKRGGSYILSGSRWHSSVIGSVFALAPEGGTVPSQNINDVRARLYDIRTGRQLNPNLPADADLLKQSACLFGSTLVATTYRSTTPCLLNLLTGTLTPVQALQNSRGYMTPVALTGQQLAIFVNMDDDGVGHSQWPTYLISTDLNGRQLWQFPKKLERDQNYNGVGASAQSLPVWIPQVQVLIAHANNLYGIDVRSGKKLWQEHMGNYENYKFATYKKGAVFIKPSKSTESIQTHPAATTAVYYLDARTGKRWPLLTGLTEQTSIIAEGDQMFLLDGQGTVRAYHIESRQNAASRRSRSTLVRHKRANY